MKGLYVITQCAGARCALPALSVERLVVPDDVRPAPGADGEVLIAGRRYPALDLGVVLGLGPAGGSSALVSLDVGPRGAAGAAAVTVAVAIGRCEGVRSVERTLPLSRASRTGPASAVSLAFAIGGQVGIMVELVKLLALHLASPVARARVAPVAGEIRGTTIGGRV